MSEPVSTALDPRYSDPAATVASWDETRKVLETAELFWISTVRADGHPHVTPVVAVWADGAVHFHTGADEQKFLNLRAHPHVVLTTGCNSWDQGLDVVVEGEAVQVTDEDALNRIAAAWKPKWDGRWQLVAHDGGFRSPNMNDNPSVAFSVRPTRIFAHAKGDPFGATTHRF
jgi:nitroimidazol reductase NimA-like FMN-containing flavoprotein (pyridoxamine 5'-phosphate oxidase superfamily)